MTGTTPTPTGPSPQFYLQDGGENGLAQVQNEITSLSPYALDFTEASDSEWQWHQLDHMQVCTSLQTDNHASIPTTTTTTTTV